MTRECAKAQKDRSPKGLLFFVYGF
jgi:hypothetical protein